MRKIFSLFVAMTAVVSLSAKTVYLMANDDWNSFEAVFFVHSWGASDADAKLAPVSGDKYLFSATIPDGNNNVVFVRMKGGSESIIWDGENKYWTKTEDLVIPTGKDCFWLIGWEKGAWMSNGERPSVAITGNFEGDPTWAPTAHPMTPATDKASASVTFHLNAATYEMKVWVESNYLSLNGEGETKYRIHRDYNHAENVNLLNDGRNFEFVADKAGDYTFTWEYTTRNLVVTFPTATGIENQMVNNNAIKRMVNGQLVIIRDGKTFNALGAEVR